MKGQKKCPAGSYYTCLVVKHDEDDVEEERSKESDDSRDSRDSDDSDDSDNSDNQVKAKPVSVSSSAKCVSLPPAAPSLFASSSAKCVSASSRDKLILTSGELSWSLPPSESWSFSGLLVSSRLVIRLTGRKTAGCLGDTG
jgi:hypothetical protein